MTSHPHGTGREPDGLEPSGSSGTGGQDGSGEPARGGQPDPQEQRDARRNSTRLGMIWTATVVGLILLVLLIVFIAQNQDQVMLRYFGFEGQVALGLALFIASVGGGIVVAAAGAARIIQLRHRDRKHHKTHKNGKRKG